MKYIIDGLFLTKRLTGIERYALEIVNELDRIIRPGELELVIPNSAKSIQSYTNIQVSQYGNHGGIKWEQIDLPRYLRKKDAKGIFLCNSVPIQYPVGIVTIHDVCCKARPDFFTSSRNKLSAYWYRSLYYVAAKSEMDIVTVSEFSKNEIENYYHVPSERITVIHNGWQHTQRIHATESVFEKYPRLEPGRYYFSMSSLMPNKNYKWILNAAKADPDTIFAVSGSSKLVDAAKKEGFDKVNNIEFLDYASDEDAKALMARCKAFIYPSYYEGFGIPPMEAVASGAKTIILSEIPALREIYGDGANYIDPDSQTGICGELTQVDAKGLLDKYSWEESAEKLYGMIKEKC